MTTILTKTESKSKQVLPATKQNSRVGASLPHVGAVPLAVSRILPALASVVRRVDAAPRLPTLTN